MIVGLISETGEILATDGHATGAATESCGTFTRGGLTSCGLLGVVERERLLLPPTLCWAAGDLRRVEEDERRRAEPIPSLGGRFRRHGRHGRRPGSGSEPRSF